MLSFIYTRCASAKARPHATGVLMDLHELSADDAALAKKLRLVSGRIRNIYSSGTLDLRLVLADVKTLALEETANARRE